MSPSRQDLLVCILDKGPDFGGKAGSASLSETSSVGGKMELRIPVMLLAALALIIVQASVMFGFTVTMGLAWNLHGIIMQYCFVGQYVISYCFGAFLERYSALERLPARLGYSLAPLLYTAAYVGTIRFRPTGAHQPTLGHLQSDWQAYSQQPLSPRSDRVPTVNVQLAPHSAPSGLMLSTTSKPWLLLDCFVTQTWSVMFVIGLLVFSRAYSNSKPGKLAQLMIDAAFTFYVIFPLILVSLAKAFENMEWHPFAYIGIVWPLCFVTSYGVAIAIRNIPDAELFL